MTHTLILRLNERLTQPLPGWKAHARMAPEGRDPSIRLKVPESARRSGVLILLYPNPDLHIVFMKRTEDGHVHSGQISFPGGRYEEQDTDLEATALREAYEEVGVAPDSVEVIGPLSELYIPPSNSLVFPTLAYVTERPAFIPNPAEVAEVLEIPLDFFLQKDAIQSYPVKLFTGHEIQAKGFKLLGKHVVWGATAMMMSELISLIEEIEA